MGHISVKQMARLGLLFVVMAAVIAACSGRTENPSSTAGNRAATGDKPGTKIFKAENGEIEIPANPQRIVAIQFVGDLLALGVKPVGVGSIVLSNSEQLKDELAGVADVGDVSVEKVLELAPDLIVAPSYLPPEVIEKLGKIAPTVTLPWGGFAGSDPLEEVRTFGRMLGKEKEAEAWIARYKEKAAQAKQKLAGVIGPGETAASYEIWAKNLWVWDKNQRAGYNLFATLGLTPPDKVKKDVFEPGKSRDISQEVLPEYAADHMFVTVYQEDGGAERAKELMDNSIWKNLPAVKNNRVYLLNLKQFWFSDGLSLEKQLDILTETILSRNQK
ncbi:iron-hydroxamate ABC transporter substrate-binding protein [Paenibacillus elgii]|uniref:iron-hydroxamate ABC transporter substrate-binding protein n=1 Tax=Paenibacillus elgii TaxID=189691 RepID=UPI0013D55653|nr:iron-hydroxamate ABC transporter substrate-binding protein [Paenibacillus elgii]